MNAGQNAGEVRWSQAGLLLLAAFCGMAVIELLLRLLPIPIIPEMSRIRMQYNISSLDECAPGAVLVLGDSSTPSAFDTELLAQTLQRPVCLRFLRGPIAMYASYHILDQALRKRRPPSLLILMFSPDFWDHPVDVRRLTQVTATVKPWRFEVLAMKAFDWLALNQTSHSLKELFFGRGQGFVFRKEYLEALVTEREKRIAEMGKSDFFASPRTIRGIGRRDAYRADVFQAEHFHFEWLERIFQRASAEGIPVVLTQGPILRGFFSLWPKKLRQQRAELRRLTAKYPLALLHANGFYYRIGYRDLWDTHWHLHERERGNFTRAFLQQLEKDLEQYPKLRNMISNAGLSVEMK